MGSRSSRSSSSSGSSDSSDFSVCYNDKFQELNAPNCSHSKEDLYTDKIYLKRVPRFKPATNRGLIAGRVFAGIFTFGLSEAGYGFYKLGTSAGDGFNHYFLEMYFKCSKCEEKGISTGKTYTLELKTDRPYFQPGYYRDCEYRDSKNGKWSYNFIQQKFEKLKDKEYNQTKWNCQHYARHYFHKIL